MEEHRVAISECSSDERAPKVRRVEEPEPEPEPESETESDSSGSLSPSESFKERIDCYLSVMVEDGGLSMLSLTDEDYKQAMVGEGRFKEGDRLVQVFSVQFLDYKKVNLKEMYGLLLLSDGCNEYVLFERLPGDPLPIDSDGFVELTGPTKVIDGLDCLEFYAFLNKLKGHCRKSGSSLWYGRDSFCLVLCNKLLSKTYDTEFGPLQVNFAVFTPSVGAILEVKYLYLKGSEDKVKVWGEVTARANLIADNGGKICMFKREKNKCAVVRPGEALPLSVSYMVLPVRSGIVVDVHLYHSSDNDSTSGANDLILNDALEVLVTQRDGKLFHDLSGVAQLKITWGMPSIPQYVLEGFPFASSLSSTSEQGCQPPERMERRFAEIFSVRFCEEVCTRNIYGFALLESSDNRTAVLFRRKSQDLPLVRKTGDVKLNGLMHGVEVKDELVIYAYLWIVSPLIPRFNLTCGETLWKADVHKTDEFICKVVETNFGPLEMNFAVYSDGMEAHMEVALDDWDALDRVEVFGEVHASNNTIPGGGAASKLFDRPDDEAVIVEVGKDVTSLPLSRSVIVVPRESILVVQVMISLRDNSSMYEELISKELSFDAKSTVTQTKVAYGTRGNVQVTVTFGR